MAKLITIKGYGRCRVCRYVFDITHFKKYGTVRERDRLKRELSPCCGAVILPYRKRAKSLKN